MSYQTNNQELNDIREYSYKERSRMAREKKKQELVSNIVSGFLGFILIIAMALAFVYALANDPWNPPVENPAYVNEYETPDAPKYIYPEA